MFRLAESSMGHPEPKAPSLTPDMMNLSFGLYGMKSLPSPKSPESCLKLGTTEPRKHNPAGAFHYPGETTPNIPWGVPPSQAECQTSPVSGGVTPRPQSNCGAQAEEKPVSPVGFEGGRAMTSPLDVTHGKKPANHIPSGATTGQYIGFSEVKMEKRPGELFALCSIYHCALLRLCLTPILLRSI